MSSIDEIMEKCRGDELPPCQAACPLHVDARGYINLIKQCNLEEALKLVYEKLPFPETMGRICTHPCELQCSRGEIGGPIAIASLKRFITDNVAVGENRFTPPLAENKKGKIAIVGGGPAGLMAAYDLRIMGYQPIIFEASPVLGGMLALGIPEYRLPRDVLNRELDIISRMGIEVRLNTRIGDKIKLADLKKDYDAVFLATGSQLSRRLDVPGKDLEGVLWGVDFLREVNLGHKVPVKPRVVVVGGGNVAIDVALTALRLGAREVQLACLESRDEMPAFEWEIQQAIEEGVKLNVSWGPEKIVGDKDNKRVTGVEFVRCTCVFDEKGLFRPSFDKSQTNFIPADMVIMAIGQAQNLTYLEGEEVQVARGLISADRTTLATNVSGIFAGGDVVTGPGVVIDALAAGRRAAIIIDRYLRGEEMSVPAGVVGSQESRIEMDLTGVASKGRAAMPLRPLEQRRGFEETELGFSADQAAQESERCLQCECRLCVKNCEFLKSVCATPRELAEKLKDSFRETPKIPYSCNLCRLCKRFCPEELDIGQMCLDMRRQLVEEGLGPLPGHKPILVEQEWVSSDAFSLVVNGSSQSASKQFFFPGCSLSAASPDLVVKTYEYLQEKLPGTGIILGCCGAPSYMIGDQKRFENMMGRIIAQMEKAGTSELIVACPDCYHTFKENAPGIKLKSVYEVMMEHGLPEAPMAAEGRSFAIHDPCKTRYESGIQDSVRAIANKLGYSIKEPEFSRDTTRCCGMGGMVAYVDIKLVNKITMARAKEMSGDVLTYCASCRDAFALVGKPAVHILDVLFNPKFEEAKKRFPTMGAARRKNQSELRARLLEKASAAAK